MELGLSTRLKTKEKRTGKNGPAPSVADPDLVGSEPFWSDPIRPKNVKNKE